jgi:hypothetical protein
MGQKFVKLVTHSFMVSSAIFCLCCICCVVWRCKDGAPHVTWCCHIISYWANWRCTICMKKMKPAILIFLHHFFNIYGPSSPPPNK